MLRLATPQDASALVGIYGQYIHTPITFEYQLPSPQEFQDRITHTQYRLCGRSLAGCADL